MGKTKVITVDGSMVDDVLPLVSLFDNPFTTDELWTRTLTQPWAPDRPSGIAAVVDGEMVGFMGTAFVDREIDGRIHTICNLHTLILRPEARGLGLKMMVRSLRITDATLTAMTAVRDVHHVLTRVGFVPLERRVRVLTPSARRRSADGGAVRLTDGVEAVSSRVDGPEARLVTDHSFGACDHLLVESARGRCLVISADVAYPWLHTHVVHIGDPDVFAGHSEAIRRHLTQRSGARLVTADARLLAGRPVAGSVTLPVDVRRMYRPHDGLDGARIDNLYSELALLRVSEIPNAREELRQRLEPVLTRIQPLRDRLGGTGPGQR